MYTFIKKKLKRKFKILINLIVKSKFKRREKGY